MLAMQTDYAGYFDEEFHAARLYPVRSYDLQPAQLECLRYASHGLTWREIAAARDCSPHTVHTLLAQARSRLAAKTTAQAVAIALRARLID